MERLGPPNVALLRWRFLDEARLLFGGCDDRSLRTLIDSLAPTVRLKLTDGGIGRWLDGIVPRFLEPRFPTPNSKHPTAASLDRFMLIGRCRPVA